MHTVKTLTTGRLNVVHSIAIQLHHFWRLRFLLLVVTHSKCILRHLHQNIVPLLPFFPHCFSNCIKITETHTVPMYNCFIHTAMFVYSCKVWGSHRGFTEYSSLLGCDAVLLTFQRIILPSSSGPSSQEQLNLTLQQYNPYSPVTNPKQLEHFFFSHVSFKQIILQSHCSACCQSELHYHISHNLPSLKLNKVGSDIIMLCVLSFQLLNQVTNIHGTWHQHYATGAYHNSESCSNLSKMPFTHGIHTITGFLLICRPVL